MMKRNWLWLFMTILFFLLYSCESEQTIDLGPHGIQAKINWNGTPKIHDIDLIVARELSIGSGDERVQLLIVPLTNQDITQVVERYLASVEAESGYLKTIEMGRNDILYAYEQEDDLYYQFKLLAWNDSLLVSIRAHPRSKLHLNQAMELLMIARTFHWYDTLLVH
jgi:hypothetical protein